MASIMNFGMTINLQLNFTWMKSWKKVVFSHILSESTVQLNWVVTTARAAYKIMTVCLFDAFFTCLNYLLYERFSSAICNLIHIWCLQNSKFGVNTGSNLDVDKLMVLRLYQNQILNQTSVLTHLLTCSCSIF